MTLQDSITMELDEITKDQQTLARRKTFLMEARTQLRTGLPEAVVVAMLGAKGITVKEVEHAS